MLKTKTLSIFLVGIFIFVILSYFISKTKQKLLVAFKTNVLLSKNLNVSYFKVFYNNYHYKSLAQTYCLIYILCIYIYIYIYIYVYILI